ncbi:unnamed protein product [Discosporangium mesarthrocarpum]
MEVEAFQRLDPENFYRRFVAKNVRPDGRELRAVRPVSVDTDLFSEEHVGASALVGIGHTKVVAGITLQVGQPCESSPQCGDVDVQVFLTPLSSSKFGGGRPSEQAQTLGTFVRSSVVESGAIRLEDLCIDEGGHAWKLCIDIMCLSFDGNLMDACLIAALAALLRLKLPDTSTVDDEVVVKGDIWTPLPVKYLPLPLTCGVFDGMIITDPSLLEEQLLTTNVTVVQTPSGKVCGVHKPGGSCVSGEQLHECLELCLQHAKQLQDILDTLGKYKSSLDWSET